MKYEMRIKAPPSSGKGLGATAHEHLIGHTKTSVFAHTQERANLTSCKKLRQTLSGDTRVKRGIIVPL